MVSDVSESMKVVLLISSLRNWPEHGPLIASINTLQKVLAKWNHVSVLFIEESSRLAINKTTNAPEMEGLRLKQRKLMGRSMLLRQRGKGAV